MQRGWSGKILEIANLGSREFTSFAFYGVDLPARIGQNWISSEPDPGRATPKRTV
jgi:hypothetical protein